MCSHHNQLFTQEPGCKPQGSRDESPLKIGCDVLDLSFYVFKNLLKSVNNSSTERKNVTAAFSYFILAPVFK